MSTNGYDHDTGYGNGADETDFEEDDLMEDSPDLYEDYMDFDDTTRRRMRKLAASCPTSSCAACCCRPCPANRFACIIFRV